MESIEVTYQEEEEKVLQACEGLIFCPKCMEPLTKEHRQGMCFRTFVREEAARRTIERRNRQ